MYQWVFLVAATLFFPALLPQVYGADPCTEVFDRKNGAYNILRSSSSSTLKTLLDEYIYHKDFRTHDEAISSGLTIGTAVYGVPIKVGGTFTKEQRDTWKREYETRRTVTTDSSEYRTFESLTSDTEALRIVTHCIIKTRSRGFGVNVDLQQVGDCNFNLSVWYRPNSSTDLPPRFEGFTIHGGGQCADPNRWFITYGGWTVPCWRKYRQPLQISVNSSKNSASTDVIDALPEPPPMPTDKPVMEPDYEAGPELITGCTFDRPQMGNGAGVCQAPGPITHATYDCAGEYCPWSVAVGAINGDNYDHSCATCRVENDKLHFARYINSAAPGLVTYKVWYKAAKGQKCVKNCDYGARLLEWEQATKRNCGPGTASK